MSDIVDVANNLQMTERVNTILDYLGESVKSGTELVKDQAPLLAQDIISWGIYSNFTFAGICFLFICGVVLFIKKMSKVWNDKDLDSDSPAFFFSIASSVIFGIVSIFMFFAGCDYLNGGIKASVAPRVYLIEWTAAQIKVHKR